MTIAVWTRLVDALHGSHGVRSSGESGLGGYFYATTNLRRTVLG